MPAVSYNPDNFYDPYSDPWNTDPTSPLNNRWWLNPAWITGGMNPPPFGPTQSPPQSGGGGGAPQPAPQPQPEPQPPADNPQTPGGTTPNFETTGWDVGDWGSPGGGNAFTYFSDPSSPSTGNYFTNFTTPGSGGGGGFPVSLFPWLDKLPGLITGGGGGGGGGQQQPQQPSQPGQQGQQGSQTGNLLAALPMLAAFQGGTTTTPAPYAHLGPHTPVAPTFKPQGRGNPIPSIGQLLAGVK
jgi:hypothetical protein